MAVYDRFLIKKVFTNSKKNDILFNILIKMKWTKTSGHLLVRVSWRLFHNQRGQKGWLRKETPDVREGMSEKLETIFGRGVS